MPTDPTMSAQSGTAVLAMPRLAFKASPAPSSPSRPTRSPQRPSPSSHRPSASPQRSPSTTSPAPTGFSGAWLTPPHPKSACPPISRPHTAGFQNLGNTCFLNAALQCLLHAPPLTALLLHPSPHRNLTPHARFCPYCALRTLASALHDPSANHTLSPTAFARHARTLCPAFRPGRQEDAHEFVRGLLDGMTRAETSGCGSASAPRWDRELQADVHRVFGGALQSRVVCTGCRHASVVAEPFLDLSLEIARAPSVERALSRFTCVETLSGDNRYRCDSCRNLVVAQKRFSVRRAPNVLTLHLKRFDRARKDCRFISFPEKLDLSEYMVGKPKSERAMYELTGVLVHHGSSRQYGHYFSYVKGWNGSWCLKDDSTSRTVPVATVLKQKAYLLFYCRVQKPAASPTNSTKSAKAASKSAQQTPSKSTPSKPTSTKATSTSSPSKATPTSSPSKHSPRTTPVKPSPTSESAHSDTDSSPGKSTPNGTPAKSSPSQSPNLTAAATPDKSSDAAARSSMPSPKSTQPDPSSTLTPPATTAVPPPHTSPLHQSNSPTPSKSHGQPSAATPAAGSNASTASNTPTGPSQTRMDQPISPNRRAQPSLPSIEDETVELSEESSDDDHPGTACLTRMNADVASSAAQPSQPSRSAPLSPSKERSAVLPSVARKFFGPLGRRLENWEGAAQSPASESTEDTDPSEQLSAGESGSSVGAAGGSNSGTNSSGSTTRRHKLLIGGGDSVQKMLRRVFNVTSPERPDKAERSERKRRVSEASSSTAHSPRPSSESASAVAGRRESRDSFVKLPKLPKLIKKSIVGKTGASNSNSADSPLPPTQPAVHDNRRSTHTSPAPTVPERPPPSPPLPPPSPTSPSESTPTRAAPSIRAPAPESTPAPSPSPSSSTAHTSTRPGSSSLFRAEGVDRWDCADAESSPPTNDSRHRSFVRPRIPKRRRASDDVDAEYDRGKQKKTRTRFGPAGAGARNAFDQAAEGRRRNSGST